MIKDPPKKKKKKKPLSDSTPEPPTKKTIPKHELTKFVGKVDSLWKIEAIHLWESNFRINAWIQTQVEGQITTNYKIDKSFFVVYNEANGSIVDKTIQPQTEEK